MGAAQLCTDRYRIARLDQLSKSARELVRNPANLLAVIRVLEQGRTVPENEFDLHQTLLQPIIEKWQKDNVMSYLTELQLAAEVFAETGRSDVLTQRKFADQDALVEARVVIRRAGGLFFANDRLPAFLVADAIVKEPDAVSRMKLVANDQWRLIFDMISRELPLASVSVLVGALLESATPSGLT
ncbi:MAG: hypothetical protein ACREXP_18395, partial [Steroidobacteraceae bacterium]